MKTERFAFWMLTSILNICNSSVFTSSKTQCLQNDNSSGNLNKKVLIAIVTIFMATSVSAQNDAMTPYYELDQLPKLIDIMPAPPSFDSPEFANDVVRYSWGKQQRQDPDRVALAIADAEWNDHAKLFLQWKDAFGLEITPISTPQIWKLMETSLATTDPMRKETKAYYKRQRPFERFNDSMPSHEEDELRGEGSYPSGHSLRGWGISLLLAQIAPERADEIFSRVDASRTAASIGFCALQGSEEFITQMKKAQQEYKEKTGQSTGVKAAIVEHPASRVYHLDGSMAKGSTRGIVIENNRKIAKN